MPNDFRMTPVLPNHPSLVLPDVGRPSFLFESNSRRLFADGVLVWMNGPAVRSGAQWHVSAVDKALIIDPLLRPESVLAAASDSLIVIDPGHGGPDSGALDKQGLAEKTLVLDIARRAARTLDASGLKVKLTRDGDQGMTLASRAEAATRWKASLLVSIHLNFAQNASASGIETFVLTPPHFPSTAGSSRIPESVFPANRHDAASMALAFPIHSRLLKITGHSDRGIKHARFDILRNAPCPAILVECGFLSNPRDKARLADPAHRIQLAACIAEGIQAYIRDVRLAHKTAQPPSQKK